MSTIVLGLGTSHTPQISTPSELWGLHADRDRAMPELDFRGAHYDFETLRAHRSGEDFSHALTPAGAEAMHERCQIATAHLTDELKAANVDVAIVFGNDHREFFANNLPAMGVYLGESIDSVPIDPESVGPSIRPALWARQADRREAYPCDAALSAHVIAGLVEDGFDMAAIDYQDPDRSIGHAYTHVRRRIMGDEAVPIVPVIINSYYPPNQPTARRCVELGRAVRRAVEAYPGDLRVAVVASGGLSHFVVDEQFDRMVIDAMSRGDLERLGEVRDEELTQGTAETRHWFAAAGALGGLDFDYCEYVPGYRTDAGTGCGMAFAAWK
jgi:hypothetical protein